MQVVLHHHHCHITYAINYLEKGTSSVLLFVHLEEFHLHFTKEINHPQVTVACNFSSFFQFSCFLTVDCLHLHSHVTTSTPIMLQSMSSTQPYTARLRDQTQHYHSKCNRHQHGVGYEPDYWVGEYHVL